MKIAVVGNFDKEISKESTGGSEVFTYLLASELAKNDLVEEIDVYGVGKNHFTEKKIHFQSLLDVDTRTFIKDTPLLYQLSQTRTDLVSQIESNIAVKLFALLQQKKYDLIHDNSTSGIFNSLSSLITDPVLTTLHTNADSPSIAIPLSLNLTKKDSKHWYVTIAKHQSKLIHEYHLPLHVQGNIYNGIAVSDYSFFDGTDNEIYGFWIGRTSSKHNKGLQEAMLASTRTASTLKVVSAIDDQIYFETKIKPHITEHITLTTTPIDIKQKNSLYGHAKYLLYPIMWEEPFGLIFLESMASGTPVIAFARGASPEIIQDGETGLLVNPSVNDMRGDYIIKKTGIEGLCEAINYMKNMDQKKYLQMRVKCRKHVENNFTLEKMANNYVEVYNQLLSYK